MHTAMGTFQVHKKGTIVPKRGEVRPIHISSAGRRDLDEQTVADLVEALKRDGRFLHPIVVREGRTARYRLIAGYHRLAAWERHFGKLRPIPADIFPSDTPDPRTSILEIEENLVRKELTGAEREAETLRLAAAIKKLSGGKLATTVSELGGATETGNSVPSLAPASGGRGKKGVAQKVAEKSGITKRAVSKRVKAASAAIGEKIDLDRDTPEELERKADKRRHAEPKVVRLRRRKTAFHVDDPTPPAEPPAGEIDSKIEAWLKAFDTFGETYQFRLACLVCIRLGLDPLKMAPPAVFGLDDEKPELAVDSPAEVPPATEVAAEVQPEQPDAAADLATEDLRVADDDGSEDTADDDSEAADQENLGAEDMQDAGNDVSLAADQEPGSATKCAYCGEGFSSTDPSEMKYRRFYHRQVCVKYAKPIAIAAE